MNLFKTSKELRNVNMGGNKKHYKLYECFFLFLITFGRQSFLLEWVQVESNVEGIITTDII